MVVGYDKETPSSIDPLKKVFELATQHVLIQKIRGR
jgi:hypothetical protein